jgi:hypothetical protein
VWLCSGTFASVKLGVNRKTGEKVAIKVIDKRRMQMLTPHVEASLQSEVQILKGLNHVYVPLMVRLCRVCVCERVGVGVCVSVHPDKLCDVRRVSAATLFDCGTRT